MKKIFLTLMAILGMSCPALADGTNWMTSLPDNVYITQLSIPGAHDAASQSSSLGATQTLSLEGLWNVGVRAFDLRPTTSSADAPILHGGTSTGVTFRQALTLFKQKLTATPGEFAVIVFRNESNDGQENGKWPQIIKPILDDFDDYIVAWTPNLRLSDVRGKMLLLARDEVADSKAATVESWADNSTRFQTVLNRDGAFHLIVQDYYHVTNSTDKTNAIQAMLEESMNIHCPGRMYINHTAGYTGTFGVTSSYRANAQNTNPFATNYISSHSGPTGIVVMDFAGSNSNSTGGLDLVNAVINNNNDLTANFNGPAGEYFLQNVESGLWIQGYQAIAGADRGRWNTAANMGTYGRPFLIQNPGADGWTLNTQAGAEKMGCEYGDGGLLYLDWDGGGCPTRWKITGTKDNAYISINHDRWLSVSDGTPNMLIKDGSTRNTWKLWTREERLATLSSATEQNPIDVTWLIVNPELMNNDHIAGQWTVERNGGGDGWPDGFRPNRVFEAWNYSRMDFYQTLNVPNGKYELQAHALFSPSEGNGTCKADYDDYVANGDATVNGYLYANNESVKLPSIYSFTSPTPVADYAAKALVDGGVSIIDGWWQAARAMGEDDKFKTQTLRVDVADGQLRLGIKEENNTSPYKSHWIIIGNFTLKYLGELQDFVTPLRNQLSGLIEEAEAFNGNTTDVLQSNLDAALTAARNSLSSNNVDVLTARVATLRDALDAAKAVDDTALEQTIVLAKAEGLSTTDAESVTVNGTTADEVNNVLNALRVARKIAHIETDNATYTGNAPAEGEFYLYNVGRKAYLTSGSDWGTHAALGYPGLLATLAANGSGFTFQFNELISSTEGEGDQGRDKFLNGSPYVDGWNNDKSTYTFEPVSGKPGVYAIHSDRGYLAFDPDGEVDGGGIHHFNTVTAAWTTASNADAQWMLITKAQRLALMDNATEQNPVDATVLIRDASFNKYAAKDNPWTNLDQGWGWGERNFGDKNTETFNSQEYNLSQTISLPKAGTYELSVQSYYRDGNINPHVERVQAGETLVAAPVLYAGESTQSIMYIHAEADKAPGEGTNTAIGNFPDNMLEASRFFQNGLYWNRVRFTVDAAGDITIGIRKGGGNRTDNWIVTDNFRLTYLGGEAPMIDVTYDGNQSVADVTAIINIILNRDNAVPHKYNHSAADVNGNGTVDYDDLNILVNRLIAK